MQAGWRRGLWSAAKANRMAAEYAAAVASDSAWSAVEAAAGASGGSGIGPKMPPTPAAGGYMSLSQLPLILPPTIVIDELDLNEVRIGFAVCGLRLLVVVVNESLIVASLCRRMFRCVCRSARACSTTPTSGRLSTGRSTLRTTGWHTSSSRAAWRCRVCASNLLLSAPGASASHAHCIFPPLLLLVAACRYA